MEPRPDTDDTIEQLHARNVRTAGWLAITVAVLIGLMLLAAIAFGIWFALTSDT